MAPLLGTITPLVVHSAFNNHYHRYSITILPPPYYHHHITTTTSATTSATATSAIVNRSRRSNLNFRPTAFRVGSTILPRYYLVLLSPYLSDSRYFVFTVSAFPRSTDATRLRYKPYYATIPPTTLHPTTLRYPYQPSTPHTATTPPSHDRHVHLQDHFRARR